MRIAVDATCWVNGRGYGRFTRELLARMCERAPQHDFRFFVEEASADRIALGAGNLEVVPVRLAAAPTQAAAADGSRSPVDMLRLTRAVKRDRPDVLFFPTVYTFFPVPRGLAAVVTIHDAIAERFPHLTLPSARARLFWKLKVKLAIRQSRLVLTVSEFSAGDLERVLGIDRRRLRVTLEAPSSAFRPSDGEEEVAAAARRAGLPEGARWFVYVGGFNPHKNVDLIVRAHAELLADREEPVHLLLVGTISQDVFHGDQARIRACIDEAGSADHVHWTGFVPDDELRHLHSGAVALLLPSACEGFGLPAVEAAACGAPVVATTESPLPDVLAGGGLFIEPGDLAALRDAMRRLCDDEDERKRLGRAAHARASALSWNDTADAALAALEEAAA